MAAIALEVNDAGLVLLREGQPRPEPDSPGVAFFEQATVLVGAAGAARARLLPRATHDRFWEAPLLAPLGEPRPAGLRRADVAHAHLRSLRAALPERPTEAYLAVPGSWDRESLGLLLSAARQAGFPVAGLIDAAVAASAFFARHAEFLHLDLTRHRCVVTALRGGSAVERLRVSEAEGPGLAAAERALVESIARRFVAETRFDPLHSGESEQALCDALPVALRDLRHTGSCSIRLPGGSREHQLELARADLAADLDGHYRALQLQLDAAAGPAVVLASERIGRLPGLVERLRATGREVIELPRDAAVSATLRLRDHVRHAGEALPFVSRLPLAAMGPAA